jgi:hypothetical protein
VGTGTGWIASVRNRDGVSLQARGLGYDEVYNITRIGDLRTLDHRSTLLAELQGTSTLAAVDLDDSYAFTYDSLYRLTHAEGTSHGSPKYRFDPIGNLTGQSHDRAPRFTLPDTGLLGWDPKDRLSTASENGVTHRL